MYITLCVLNMQIITYSQLATAKSANILKNTFTGDSKFSFFEVYD